MTQSPPTPGRLRGAGPLLVPTLITLELMAGLIQGWLLPLLGEIGKHYEVSGGAVGWILTVSLLSSAVCVPLLTMIADRFGPRRLLVIAAATTTVGTLLIALAPSFPLLLIGSILQGPVAALLPLEMAILKHHRPANANRVVSALVGVLTVGVALGALGAGLVMDASRSLFTTQLVPAIAIGAITCLLLVFVPATPGDRSRTVDWLGSGLLAVALVGLMYGLSEGPVTGWGAPTTLAPIAIGAIALVLFVIVENRARTPFVDLKVLRSAGLATPILLGALVAMAMFGSQTPMILFLTSDPTTSGYGAGISTGAVGVVFAVTGLAASLGAFVAPLAVRALGIRTTITAAALVSAAALLTLLTNPSDPLLTTGIFVVVWFGLGIALAVLPGVVIDRAPEAAAAAVSGLYSTGRTIGGSLAGAAVATVLTVVTLASIPAGADAADSATPVLAFNIVWVLLAAMLVLGAVLAGFLARGRSAPSETASASASASETETLQSGTTA